TFSNEYRITYRSELTSTESVTEGKWIAKAQPGKDVPVSVDDRYGQRLHLKIGSKIAFNVQGLSVNTVVTSFRRINWNKMQTNFLFVFPDGVVNDAPQFHVLLTRVPSVTRSAAYQQAVVRQFPNVSVIDLKLILSVLDD